MIDSKNTFLFEVSWEVCNKVGGIYTVLRTKIEEVIRNFGENYILIGPLLDVNNFFVEEKTPFFESIADILRAENIDCRLGYWDTPGKPKVILVAYKNRYNVNDLLYNLWTSFGVDSLASNFEYVEPILFSTVAGEAIRAITEKQLDKNLEVLAQFHEWMCGAGILDIEQHMGHRISTVFTTHATVLGRALAGDKKDIYNLPETFDPDTEAHKLNVFSKHSMERASAKEADCFTTVSNITADEAYIMLNKYPDKIVPNGLDINAIQSGQATKDNSQARAKLIEVANKIIGDGAIPNDALLWVTSGRYEFHNKGFDVILKSLAELEKKLPAEAPPIVVFFLVAANHHSQEDSLLTHDFPGQSEAIGLATHRIFNLHNDPIIKMSRDLQLTNPNRKIHVVYSDAYLNGNDGVFDIDYDDLLPAFDLSIFPSFYEPWGYTPLESIACGVPTITSDLAGFGSWIEELREDYVDAVYVLKYRCILQCDVEQELCGRLEVETKFTTAQREKIRVKAKQIAQLADWKLFFKEYLDAYDQSIEFNEIYYAKIIGAEKAGVDVLSFHETETSEPRFRLFQCECQIPKEICGLRDLAYNLWWAWHRQPRRLFQQLDPVLWEKVQYNPVKLLNFIDNNALIAKTKDKNYMQEYEQVMTAFDNYMQDKKINNFCDGNTVISKEHPIAYFCMEYGIDLSLPIYSGGLGILAGDYLKEVSDLNVPLVAVGLFYKQGYFQQHISLQSEQMTVHETLNPNQLPMKQVLDADGKPLLISIEILQRNVQIGVWKIQVGRITLYLLDSDIAENSSEDREITSNLYVSSREVRLLQELVLGICGTRLLVEKLNMRPSLYHLNEGHSAFLLLERANQLYKKGLTLDEAGELVKSTSIFTTHTSVPAGNEIFSVTLIKKYFAKIVELLGISMDEVLNVGKSINEIKSQFFSMTALAFRMTIGINGVSKLHEQVVCSIWKNVWRGFLENEIPVDGVTNGVHLATWLGSAMRLLYDNYLDKNWINTQDQKTTWDKMANIPDVNLWESHQLQKEKLLQLVKKRIIKEFSLRNESKKLLQNSLDCLQSNTLIIGFARRFATYKRPDLIFTSKGKLARILTNKQRPVVILIAGKAHPADTAGKDIIRHILHLARDEMFQGHVIFLENYDMSLARALVQGVDVWLNNPIIKKEACGTSGMKAAINGVLNFSTKDGWWAEVCSSEIGWSIESFELQADMNKRNETEGLFLLDTIENSIAPLYYENNTEGYNPEWVRKMKNSIAVVSQRYCTTRMVKEYFTKLFCPVAKYAVNLLQNDAVKLKQLVVWKRDIAMRFNTVKIKTILVNGISKGKITDKRKIIIKLLLFSGKLTADELKVELILIKSDGKQFIAEPVIVPLQIIDKRKSGILTYTLEYDIKDTGFYSYGIRVYPHHPLLLHPADAGIVYWG
jgi:phosphorylase/glycogen(starch) synthase